MRVMKWITLWQLINQYLNSLAPGRSWCDFKNVIFNFALLIGIFKSSYDNVLRWMPQDLTDDKSTLVQVMAWCSQATSHYLNQCWPRSPTPYGVIRPQWVKAPGHSSHIIIIEWIKGFLSISYENSFNTLNIELFLRKRKNTCTFSIISPLVARFMEPKWGPPGSCQPQVGPM